MKTISLLSSLISFVVFAQDPSILEIYPEVSAKILSIAPIGTKVKKGETLVQFEAKGIMLKLAKQKNILAIKKRLLADKALELEQIQTLFDSLVRSKRELELAQIAYENAKNTYQAQNNKVNLSQFRLTKYRILAPFDAKVIQTPHLRNTTNKHHPQMLMRIQSLSK